MQPASVLSTAAVAVLAVAAVTGCEIAEAPQPETDGICSPPSLQVALPAELQESSGVAASRQHAGVYWTHNDSGGAAAVFATDSTGAILTTVRIRDAVNRDWEDMAIGPCQPDGDDCLWIAEIGDNGERHDNVAVYRIPEPAPDDTVSPPATIFRFTYPDGPRDAEALFVTERGVYVVNKGRSDAIELFRLTPPYSATSTVALDRVQRLAGPPTNVSSQVTAAAVDRYGERAVVRTYTELRFYEFSGDTLAATGQPANIVASAQLQGEGVDYVADHRFVLTSESQSARPASLVLLRCDPDRATADSTG